MISIKQSSYDLNGLNSLISKYSETVIKLNRAAIQEDINKLKAMQSNALNKQDKKNIINIGKYLSRLDGRLDSNENFEFSWMVEDLVIEAYPFELKHFSGYNIQATDYIDVSGCMIVRADYSEVFKIIAFDMMHRDLDISTETMENKLENIGITTVNKAEILNDVIPNNILLLSKVLKIEDSSYSTEGDLSWDYFNSVDKAFCNKVYSDCVGRSISIGISILTKNAILNFKQNNIEFKICALNEEGLYFLINKKDKNKVDKVFESVVVRSFGRSFEVAPKINVF